MQLTSKLPEQLIRKSLLLALVCGCASVQATSMYKWVDEDGTVHYEQYPPRGRAAENISDTYRSSKQPKPEQNQSQAQEEEENASAPTAKANEPDKPDEPEKPEKPDEVVDKVAQVKRKNCETAKANLETYKMRPRRIKQPDGTVIDMTDEILDQKIIQAESNISKYCQ